MLPSLRDLRRVNEKKKTLAYSSIHVVYSHNSPCRWRLHLGQNLCGPGWQVHVTAASSRRWTSANSSNCCWAGRDVLGLLLWSAIISDILVVAGTRTWLVVDGKKHMNPFLNLRGLIGHRARDPNIANHWTQLKQDKMLTFILTSWRKDVGSELPKGLISFVRNTAVAQQPALKQLVNASIAKSLNSNVRLQKLWGNLLLSVLGNALFDAFQRIIGLLRKTSVHDCNYSSILSLRVTAIKSLEWEKSCRCYLPLDKLQLWEAEGSILLGGRRRGLL